MAVEAQVAGGSAPDPRPGEVRAPASGREALTHHAAAAASALAAIEAATWQVAVDRDLVDEVDLLVRVVAAQHDLDPLARPAGLGPSPWGDLDPHAWRDAAPGAVATAWRPALELAEQFAIDVSRVGDDHRAALGAAVGDATLDVVQATWAADLLPRARAALDALFGPSSWPAAEPAAVDGGLWGAIDRYLRVVPALKGLDPVLTELVRLRGARLHRCRLCQSLRDRGALLAGATDVEFAAVDDWASSDLTADRKAALALTDALVWLPGRIPPAVAADVRAHLDDAQAVEVVLDITRNAANKVAVAFAADAPHVTEGFEVYEIDPDGEPRYGLTLDGA